MYLTIIPSRVPRVRVRKNSSAAHLNPSQRPKADLCSRCLLRVKPFCPQWSEECNTVLIVLRKTGVHYTWFNDVRIIKYILLHTHVDRTENPKTRMNYKTKQIDISSRMNVEFRYFQAKTVNKILG